MFSLGVISILLSTVSVENLVRSLKCSCLHNLLGVVINMENRTMELEVFMRSQLIKLCRS